MSWLNFLWHGLVSALDESVSLRPCFAVVAPPGVCEVRKLLSGLASFSRQWRCLCRIGLSLSFITRKWIKTGMNVLVLAVGWGDGKYLIGFLLECSKLFLLLIGVKIYVCK